MFVLVCYSAMGKRMRERRALYDEEEEKVRDEQRIMGSNGPTYHEHFIYLLIF